MKMKQEINLKVILVYIIRIIGNNEFRKRGEGCFSFRFIIKHI